MKEMARVVKSNNIGVIIENLSISGVLGGVNKLNNSNIYELIENIKK
jgi:hypothetical protein